MVTIVLDPGHGGTANVGGSSWNNAKGPNGRLEKTVTLKVALAAERALGGKPVEVVLTRRQDRNVGIVARANVAKSNRAAVFVSIHFNAPGDGGPAQGTETWIGVGHTQISRSLAEKVQARVRAATGYKNRGVKVGNVSGVIKPQNQDPKTANCLVEISFLSEQPAEEQRLGQQEYIDALGQSVADACLDYLQAAGLISTPEAALAEPDDAASARRLGLIVDEDLAAQGAEAYSATMSVATTFEPIVAAQSNAISNDLLQAKAELRHRFLEAPAEEFSAMSESTSPDPAMNVVGVAIGEKELEGAPTGLMAVKLLVRIKYAKNSVPGEYMLPTSIAGLPVDVEEVGDIRPLAFPDPRVITTPARPGCSIGFEFANPAKRMAGTFGALVRDQQQRLCILSNNHVIANEGRLHIGAPIFQTGLLDLASGQVKRQVARLNSFVPLNGAHLKVDAALAEGIEENLLSRDVLYIGAPTGRSRAERDMAVHKFGRTTGYTVGSVRSVSADMSVRYETGVYLFIEQILITGLGGTMFSSSGDSGSLILERRENWAVGLLFAGSQTHTLANHIADVLAALNAELA